MDVLAQRCRSVVLETLSKARAGDAEAIGWIIFVVLSIALVAVAFVQAYILGDGARGKRGGMNNNSRGRSRAVLPPSYNVGIPLIGSMVAFARDPLRLVWDAYAKKGSVFTVRFGPQRLTFVIGPAASEAFFRGSDTELSQNEPYKFSTPVFGKDVVYDATLERRLEHFRVLGLTLRVNMLETYVPMILKEAVAYFEAHWGDSGEVDLAKELAQLIILTGSRCILGREVRENLFGEVSQLIHDLDQGMQPISVLFPHLPTPAHRKRDKARQRIAQLFTPVIESRRKGLTKEDDMLQWLVEAKHRDGTPFSEAEIVGNLIAGLFASQHTSSSTSTWLGMRMLRDAGYFERVVAEQERVVLGEYGGKICYEALVKMDLLHAAMKESLRMHPPLLFLMRKVLNTRYALNGKYKIPVNDYVVCSPSVSGMLPDVYKDPHTWDPDRFLVPREEDKAAPYSFLGFGAGRHGCMGEGFAYIQVKTIWSVIINSFDLEIITDNMPKPNMNSLVVVPHMGTCKMRYKRKANK